ncbi:ribosome maturation factor RimP [Cutibacterium acnes]|uniref:ribosome maturation factor RimP n=1 Tax=Cutibacterium acnes TaxID=1747 RepID=UPI000C302F4F|nr:ribosome maturation factor RimP [Cutibacterium acnes]MCP9374456.1 ribosome maturation factor RimP [Cutibacterium acnes]PKC19648.1 ribosome maturation protein RimP [Cutibacterium acnes]
MNAERLTRLLEPVVSQVGLELDRVDVVPAGRRRLVRVTIDGDGPDGHGPSLDEISEATAEISHCLDDSGAMGESPYTLEVSSRGVSTPLTQPRHYRRNIGHLVRFTLNPAEEQKSGETFDGRIAEAGEEVVTLEVEAENSKPHKPVYTTREVQLADVAKAVVQVELNRRDAQASKGEN